MPDDNHPEKIWDEYDWERFLQEQDRKTEKYMELLERFIDDPNRDQIIAREMGWSHLLDREGQEWADNVDSQFSDGMEEFTDCDDDYEMEEDEEESYELHPLYQSSVALNAWIDQTLSDSTGNLDSHPAFVRLSTHASIASSKLAAALSDDDVDEIGMNIAYLKRALAAITTSIDSAVKLHHTKCLNSERFGILNHRLFQVRDGIILLMGEYRAEWRRRYGRKQQ